MLFKIFWVSESIWYFLGSSKKYKYPELCCKQYIDKVTILLKAKSGVYMKEREKTQDFQKILKMVTTMNLKDTSGKNYGNESRSWTNPQPPPQKEDIEDIPQDRNDDELYS